MARRTDAEVTASLSEPREFVSARRSRRWPRLAVVLAGLAFAGVMAASAPAPDDFIAGEPAPVHVSERLVAEGAADRLTPFFTGNPNVIAESAHGVAAIDTSAGRATLWAATPEPGPICYFVEFEALTTTTGKPGGEAKCGTRLSAAVPTAINLSRPVVDGRELVIVVGWAHESVASVVLRSPEGDESELPLSERFFIAEVPADRVPRDFRDGELYVVVARDRRREELQRWPVAGVPRPLFFNPKLAGPRRTVIDTRDSSGRPMRLSFIPIEGGERCVELKTRGGTSTGCGTELWVDAGIQVHPTLMEGVIFLNGSVGPEVSQLELHHQDGSVLELPIVERFVLHDIPRARFEGGKRPILLVARGHDGAKVVREKVSQRLFEMQTTSGQGDLVDLVAGDLVGPSPRSIRVRLCSPSATAFPT
jgi:hypothetical protein